MKKVAMFAFNGDEMCFVHVLLNSLDLREKGYDVALIIEGRATALIKTLHDPEAANHELYEQVKERGIIDCVCRACSHQTGVQDAVEEQGLSFGSEMKGHPSMSRYLDEGYSIISF